MFRRRQTTSVQAPNHTSMIRGHAARLLPAGRESVRGATCSTRYRSQWTKVIRGQLQVLLVITGRKTMLAPLSASHNMGVKLCIEWMVLSRIHSSEKKEKKKCISWAREPWKRFLKERVTLHYTLPMGSLQHFLCFLGVSAPVFTFFFPLHGHLVMLIYLLLCLTPFKCFFLFMCADTKHCAVSEAVCFICIYLFVCGINIQQYLFVWWEAEWKWCFFFFLKGYFTQMKRKVCLLKCDFETLNLSFSFSALNINLRHDISYGNIVRITPLHLFDGCSCRILCRLKIGLLNRKKNEHTKQLKLAQPQLAATLKSIVYF